MIDGTVTKLVWSRLTEAERAAVVARLLDSLDDDVLWEAINLGVADAESAAGTEPEPIKRAGTRARKAALAAVPADSNTDGPRRRGRPPGSKNKAKDTAESLPAAPPAAVNPFAPHA